jgi:hypothetical protein
MNANYQELKRGGDFKQGDSMGELDQGDAVETPRRRGIDQAKVNPPSPYRPTCSARRTAEFGEGIFIGVSDPRRDHVRCSDRHCKAQKVIQNSAPSHSNARILNLQRHNRIAAGNSMESERQR